MNPSISRTWAVVSGLLVCVRGGDDASVHVHVESSPGQLMAPTVLTAADWTYENHDGSRNPGILIASPAASRWQGDEIPGQGGRDAAMVMPRSRARPMLLRGRQENSEEQRSPPSFGATRRAAIVEQDYPTSDVPVYRERRFRDLLRFTEPLQERGSPASLGRTHFDYDIPFPSARRSDTGPRHQHGGSIDAIPAWLARKKLLSRYGLKKYLQPFGQLNTEELERMDPFDRHAAPVYPRTARLTTLDEPLAYYNPEGDYY
ncbi:hypothetical protein BV898_09265 [Hypsibius exemplaris]|uniref:Uncharacterized protein n=1 Tax=Hypsibius exemplaris TaxID=2072580 RepID=A0A1W0WN27_HYPEX|nr:hypothetical protein BV898_09265 [Hypsibius exemplaris]